MRKSFWSKSAMLVMLGGFILASSTLSKADYSKKIELQENQGYNSVKKGQEENWNYNGVCLDLQSPQKKGTILKIGADIDGNTEGLQYKFVWERDEWKEWGVIQEFTENNQVSFSPEKVGNYRFYVDVKDSTGNIKSKNVEYEIVTSIWNYDSIATNVSSPQEKNVDPIIIEPMVSGEVEGVQYKFVWQKNNWKEWGVISDFSEQKSVEWKPKGVGDYFVYVDIKDLDGKMYTQVLPFSIQEIKWEYEGIKCEPENKQKKTIPVDIDVNLSGNTKGIQYKFVWQKNNWQKWGVIQEFSSVNEVRYAFQEPGEYKIYIDIKDWDGNIRTEIVPYEIMSEVWEYDDLVTNLESPQEKYTAPIEIKAVTSGENENLKYKFVWQKDNWKEWGVIQDFSTEGITKWNPIEIGNYWIYVDVQDIDGKICTKKIPYQIVPVYWEYEGIEIFPEDEQKSGENIEIRAKIKGNSEKLKYKFVWMKDNWSEWGVIQDFSETQSAEWKAPDEYGKYKIYVDVLDRDGVKKTKTRDYEIVSQVWKNNGININDGVSEQVYTNIPIKAMVEGETEGLEYKYVWQRDDWSNWGIIQEFSENNEVTWFPKEAGNYKIYADVKSKDGRIKTKCMEYEVLSAPWKLDEIYVEGNAAKNPGETFRITAKTSGEIQGLKYKFVWQKNNWMEWGVIQEYSENNRIEWTPSEKGTYSIYVDVLDQRGVKFDPYIRNIGTYVFKGINLSNTPKYNKTTKVSPDIDGGAPGAQYKIVWQRNNWKKWGVLKEFSEEMTAQWRPDTYSDYVLYIDMKLEDESITTKTYNVHVGYPYSGVTIDSLLGTNGRSIVNELEAHEYDSFYLGTPYHPGHFWSGEMDPCMHPNGSPGKNGYVGMNCTGFVAVAFQRCGANIDKISAMGGSAGYTNACNWFEFAKRNGVEYYGFFSIQSLLDSGRAEKGDIIYCEPNWNLSGADCHIGFFWGDTPTTNTFWHQMEVNKISHIYSGTPAIRYYLIKTRK